MDNETKKILKEINDSLTIGASALGIIAVELFVMTMILVILL